MSSAMLPLSATAQRVAVLECAPCALRAAMRRAGQSAWTEPLADFAVDIVAGALTLGGATEVLVPASLVHHVEACRNAGGPWPWPTWDAALAERRLVTLIAAHDATRVLRGGGGAQQLPRAYRTNLCVPVPAGPLVAQMDFHVAADDFYAASLPALMDAAHAGDGTRWRAWVRGALTCAYEGTHVPPIRVADYTSQLLRQAGGCEGVLWESAVCGLTPRWLETAAKTAYAVGVPPASLALALPEESSSTARLLHKSVEVGVTAWVTCALPNTPLFPRAAPAAAPQSVQLFIAGWNDAAAPAAASCGADGIDGVASAVEEALARCSAFVSAVQERAEALLLPRT